MIILDTNVISELARANPSPAVVVWLDRQPATELHLTAITVGELSFGLARLPPGRRQRELAARVDRLIDELFAGRILPYGAEAGRHFGMLAAQRERAGRPISMADGQIAAVSLHHDATLATRNVRDFTLTVPNVIDPWSAAPRR